MKKILFFLVLSITAHCFSQTINIPDANFKARLLLCSPSNGYAYSSTLGYIKIDANDNGEIEQSEAEMVDVLNTNNSNIINLEGLQYFTNLFSLKLNNNHISNLNISGLIKLVYLGVSSNQLTSLDLTGLVHLEELGCSNNSLTQLDFSNLPNLKIVYCGNNPLTSLDFSYNPLFEDLGCKNSPNLTSIKIKNNHQQLFGSQTMLNECWTGCPNLNYICADAFEIPALQSYLSGCGITQAITIDSACPLLGTEEFEKEKFTISPNPFENEFTVSFDKLVKEVKLELFTLVGQKIYEETIENTNEHTIAIDNLPKGTYLLKLSDGEQTIDKKIIKN